MVAALDHRPANSRNHGARGEASGSFHHSMGLRFRTGVLELSDALPVGTGHLEPPEAPGQVRCRQILVELLRPLGPAAAGWAERLVKKFGSLAGALSAAPAAQAR